MEYQTKLELTLNSYKLIFILTSIMNPNPRPRSRYQLTHAVVSFFSGVINKVLVQCVDVDTVQSTMKQSQFLCR